MDVVLDYLTVSNWHNDCVEGNLPCWIWPVGAIFLALPTVVMTVVVYKYGGLLGGWSNEWCMKVLYGPLYSLGAPLYGIYVSGMSLFCGESRGGQEVGDLLKAAGGCL